MQDFFFVRHFLQYANIIYFLPNPMVFLSKR
jgi:hypothetical protein